MAEKVLILHDNRIDDATMSASSTAGTLVPANLQDRALKKVARTTGVTAEYWQAAFASGETISTVALWNHNLTAGATIRVRLSNNSDMSSPVYDTTFDAWASCYGVDEIGLDLCGLDGTPILSALNDYKPYRVIRLGSSYEALYLRLDVVDTDNTDGYLQAGRLIAGIGWQPDRNFSFGWGLDWIDPSGVTETDDGGMWFDRRDKYRVLDLPFKFAAEADALGVFNDLKRIVGHSRDILVMPFPDGKAQDQYRTTVYGVPVRGGVAPLREERHNKFTTSIKIRELIA